MNVAHGLRRHIGPTARACSQMKEIPMDPTVILFVPMVLTLILALIFSVQGVLRELKDEASPLSARTSLIINGISVAISPLDRESFTEHDAVYAILGATTGTSFEVIDAGDTSEYGSPSVCTPERQASWLRHSQNIWVGVHLLDSDEDTPVGREEIIRRLLSK